MATREKDLLKSLRDRGVRKRTAVEVVKAVNGAAKSRPARRVVARKRARS